jgi:Uma2 family endonuclease
MTSLLTAIQDDRFYPSSDGKPMAENTEQYRWIVLIAENLAAIFNQNPDVFIAADLLWYPIAASDRVKGEPYAQAPDIMVIFGRPKGFRSSYIQHKEENIAPQVVFEILSPSNKTEEGLTDLQKKLEFYQRHGVEEYYTYDPLVKNLMVWQRQGLRLVPIKFSKTWVSPRLGVRFQWQAGEELSLFKPDGRPFLSFSELDTQAEQERIRAEQERLQKEFERQEKQEAQLQVQRERQQKQEAQLQAQQEQAEKQEAQLQAQQERQEKERLAAYLRSLGLDPDKLP